MATSVDLARPAPAPAGLRQEVLTLPDVLAQSVAVMAPSMSGGFITYLAAVKAGGATPLAFLLATAACLCIGAVVAAFARSVQSAGSLYSYTVCGLGPVGGFITGWVYTTALFLAGPAVLAGASVFMSSFMAGVGAPSLLGHWWLWFAVGLAAWFALAYPGIEISTRSSLLITAAGMAVLALLAVVVVVRGGAHGNTRSAFSPGAAGVGWPGVFGGVAFGILSFTGFETAANLAEETRRPRRNIPLAVLGSVVIGGVFYIAVTYATSIGYGVREATAEWPQSASGLAPLAGRYAGYLEDLVLLAVATSAFCCGLAVSNAATRSMFTMARDGVLPAALGRAHPRHQTPHVALFVYLAGAVVFTGALIAATGPATRDAIAGGGGPSAAGLYVFTEGLTLITPPIMLAYLLTSLAGLAHGWRHRRRGLVAAAAGSLAGAAAAVFGSLYYSFAEAAPGAGVPTPYRVIPWLLLAWVMAGAALALALRRARPGAWAALDAAFRDS